jgi:flagellar biosynthesis regulator FlbT
MQYVLTRLKIKPGKEEATEEFIRYFADNRLSETMATLDEAKILLECSFIDKHADGTYLYIFKKLENLEHLKDRIANSKLKLYEEIRAWADECLENRLDLDPLASFDRS